MPSPIVYMAHPYGGKPANIAKAKRWLRFLWIAAPRFDFVAPWLPVVEVLNDADVVTRARGLAFDCEVVKRCDGLVLVGGTLSPGMEAEVEAIGQVGRAVYNLLTAMGSEPPADLDPEALALLSHTLFGPARSDRY